MDEPLHKLRMAAPESVEATAHRFEREQRATHLQREANLDSSLAPFRVGSVRYLNAVPLTRGLEKEVCFATPSQLAQMLRRDELDAALVSLLIASGMGEGWPLTVGCSNSSAFPPPGFFISRSAISVISNSVATGCEIRLSSPARSSVSMNSRKDENAIAAESSGGNLPVKTASPTWIRKLVLCTS